MSERMVWPGLGARKRRCEGGFTLIELLVAIAVLAVLMGVAIPSFSEYSLSNKLRSYSTNLAASVQVARSEAIKRNAVVRLCVSSNGTSCGSGGWQQGWIVLAPDNTVIHAQAALASGYVVTATKVAATTAVTVLRFQPSGVGLKLNSDAASAAAEFRICRASPSAGGQARKVSVSSTGRTSVKRTDDGTCSET